LLLLQENAAKIISFLSIGSFLIKPLKDAFSPCNSLYLIFLESSQFSILKVVAHPKSFTFFFCISTHFSFLYISNLFLLSHMGIKEKVEQ